MIPLREENLRFPIRSATARPRKLFAIGRKDGQAVEARCLRHADGLRSAFGVGDEELEVFKAMLVRGEDDVFPARVKVRRPRHALEVRDLPHISAVGLHREHIRIHAARVETPPHNARAVRREKRAAIVARRLRKLPHVRAVGVHDVDIAKPGGVFLQTRLLLGVQVAPVRSAQRAEDDLLSVR